MSGRPIKILLQTTIPTTEDDWSIARFSQLASLLEAARTDAGESKYEVTMRDRDPLGAPDKVLSGIDRSDYDELWLFAVDVGDGLTQEDCAAILRFWNKGRGLMVTRDHMDLGSSVCALEALGQAHHFHTRNVDPEPAHRQIDDTFTHHISWPNYHSGANGDFQTIEPVLPVHPVLFDPAAPNGHLQFLPTHPHEGAVAAPAGATARVIATGKSLLTGRSFNIAVAFEATAQSGRAVAQSTFHHFADYNWNPSSGCPSFVDEPAGGAIVTTPEALASTHRYALNVASWLGGQT